MWNFRLKNRLDRLNLFFRYGSTDPTNSDETENSRGSQNQGSMTDIIMDSREDITRKQRHFNDFLTVAPCVSLIDKRQVAINGFSLELGVNPLFVAGARSQRIPTQLRGRVNSGAGRHMPDIYVSQSMQGFATLSPTQLSPLLRPLQDREPCRKIESAFQSKSLTNRRLSSSSRMSKQPNWQ